MAVLAHLSQRLPRALKFPLHRVRGEIARNNQMGGALTFKFADDLGQRTLGLDVLFDATSQPQLEHRDPAAPPELEPRHAGIILRNVHVGAVENEHTQVKRSTLIRRTSMGFYAWKICTQPYRPSASGQHVGGVARVAPGARGGWKVSAQDRGSRSRPLPAGVRRRTVARPGVLRTVLGRRAH